MSSTAPQPAPGFGPPASAAQPGRGYSTSAHDARASTPARPGTQVSTVSSTGGGSSSEPRPGGMRAMAGLLQFALLASIAVYLWQAGPELLARTEASVNACEAAGGGLPCLTSTEVWRYALWPLAACIAAVSLFRGAVVANARRDGGGMVLTLAGFGVLGLSLLWALG